MDLNRNGVLELEEWLHGTDMLTHETHKVSEISEVTVRSTRSQ